MRKKKEEGMASIGEDVLQNILSRLPALSYARATCTCRTWNRVCHRVLSRPKLLSALSLKPNLQDAVEEASDKLLSEPFQPHFAIAFVGRKFSLRETHELIRAKMGTRIPIVTSCSQGIIGRDALTNELKEVSWNVHPSVGEGGIVLIAGFLPGLKVAAIPLIRSKEKSQQGPIVKSFLSNIKSYTESVSNSTSPMGIVMIADHSSDIRSVLEQMDYTLGGETIITGDVNGYFLFSSGDKDGPGIADGDAVALVFAKDRDKPDDIGEIHFELALSTGVSPIGPVYKAASVRVIQDEESECCTWLTATREGFSQRLDGATILSDLEAEMENDNSGGDFYIGVAIRRKCSIGSRRGKFSSFAFREVLGGDEEYLYVQDKGIRTGDTFRVYFPNVETALASRNNVFEKLKNLKNRSKSCCREMGISNRHKVEVFGGLMFTCCARGESFFGDPNVDSSVFSENFPDIPLAGMFCMGEIGSSPSIKESSEEVNPNLSCLHVYSAVYLVMSYTTKTPELRES
ncbi:F-box/LRR protein isoform X2 [Tasmannia lanceolata]|uniref:F-box/LRR protein isoform X2 n=1 Tax=Tasmannia lanceolata TaxID=3420 RepID=UPI004063A78B